jgi:endonuclease/exonuclease/phosphatase family metal-dependent hydrolase
MRCRILTFNVWNEEGDPGRIDLINRELRRLDPDLVALQEVVRRSGRDQMEELLSGLTLYGTHQVDAMGTPVLDEDRYGGNAVATRWPHRVAEVLDVRAPDAMDVPWRTLAVTVTVPDLGELLFVCTTTAWRPGAESARERQAVALSELDVRHRCELPTIAVPDSSSIRYLTGLQPLGGRSVLYHDAWALAGKGPGHTWSADNPHAATVMDQIVGQPGIRRRFDYVLVGSWDAHPNVRCRVLSAELTFTEPQVSDHFGVMVDVELTRRVS